MENHQNNMENYTNVGYEYLVKKAEPADKTKINTLF